MLIVKVVASFEPSLRSSETLLNVSMSCWALKGDGSAHSVRRCVEII